MDMAPGRVPHTMMYVVSTAERNSCSVRHQLNDLLRQRSGRIGYAVAPPFRRRGFAGEILRQALGFGASLGLRSVMITCDNVNVGSWKTIERAGGVLAEPVWDAEVGEWIRRYWIDVRRVRDCPSRYGCVTHPARPELGARA